jgi:serine-type D-Ala-D-Ala carboxypeptidase/endopeptidase (penicillin-binding protein 4)
VRRTRTVALLTLALINVFTLAAGLAVARMLPARLAALKVPTIAAAQIHPAGPVLSGDTGGPMPTASGLQSALSGPLSASALGSGVGAVVTDPATGRVLWSQNPDELATPASTTKLATSLAALAVLGPDARFTTKVVQGASPDQVILVGGGDPTLAVNAYPSQDYPQPATLASLAAATASKLKAEHRTKVSLDYDTSLYSGPDLAPGWSQSYVSTGDVTPISSLEVDQGRLGKSGAPEDSDDPYNLRPRSEDPAGVAADAFAGLLKQDGIALTQYTAGQAPAHAATIASVSSPPLSAIVQQMLQESNNVIAENLARHVALAAGKPASFSSAAGAEITELRHLGVTTGIRLVDGSGLSPQNGIAPATLVKVIELAMADPRLRSLLAGLPVAGFSGTLSKGQSVFAGIGGAAVGSVRAKTGNLSTVTTLAGTAADTSGSTLAFAFMADQIPSAGLLDQAANALDQAAAALANCGCQ